MVLSVSQERPPSISYQPLPSSSFCSAAFLILNAFGIIAFAFRGHNLALEIQKLLYLGFQATMASIFKHPAHVPMWRGAKVAYLLIAMCLFPIAIGGLWAYGNLMPQGGILNALYIYHSHDIPRGLLATTFLFVVFNCLSSFQIYSMPVFDSFEAALSMFHQFVGIMESKTWIWNRKSTGKNIEKGKTLELEKFVENLNEQLSSVCSESNAKDDLLAKQAKVAEDGKKQKLELWLYRNNWMMPCFRRK
ncbi:hypothetical protein ZIOFF_054037 [Zingiber officinale]|uniref:Amino acid transporter transmembrane domain-containing protein n=1 Tax=Zingiber officinale TaxID=94328 RepID=A0A8J5FD61_ZINOF|nr:hypothetical protein ZIOFF_054037 [Zingiber officinale]